MQSKTRGATYTSYDEKNTYRQGLTDYTEWKIEISYKDEKYNMYINELSNSYSTRLHSL